MSDAQQVVVEELGRPCSVPLRPRLLVAPELTHRLRFPHVQQRRRLRLHHHQRDAVDEEHKVGDDHPLVVIDAAPLVAPADAELRRDDELVEAALGAIEIEEAHDARLPPSPGVNDEGHAVGQVLVDPLVAGHAGSVDVLQLKDGALGLLIRHPLVEAEQRAPQPSSQQHLPLVAALRRQCLTMDVCPPQTLQQPTGRFLGVVVLVEFGGNGVHRIPS